MKRDARLQPDQEVSFIVENLKLLTALAQPNFRPQIDLLVTKSYDKKFESVFLLWQIKSEEPWESKGNDEASKQEITAGLLTSPSTIIACCSRGTEIYLKREIKEQRIKKMNGKSISSLQNDEHTLLQVVL
uniref:Uncharacterized protein n=1 Tax=Solanum lycopersicum TaxID=4081 RepID=A0A3Q7I9R6_SOLLC